MVAGRRAFSGAVAKQLRKVMIAALCPLVHLSVHAPVRSYFCIGKHDYHVKNFREIRCLESLRKFVPCHFHLKSGKNKRHLREGLHTSMISNHHWSYNWDSFVRAVGSDTV